MDPSRKHPPILPPSDRPTSRAIPAARPMAHSLPAQHEAPRFVLRRIQPAPVTPRPPTPPAIRVSAVHQSASDEETKLQRVESDDDFVETAVAPPRSAAPPAVAMPPPSTPSTPAPPPSTPPRGASDIRAIRPPVPAAAARQTATPAGPAPLPAVSWAVPGSNEPKALLETAERAIAQLRWVLQEFDRRGLGPPTRTPEIPVDVVWEGNPRRRRVAIAMTILVALGIATLLAALALSHGH